MPGSQLRLPVAKKNGRAELYRGRVRRWDDVIVSCMRSALIFPYAQRSEVMTTRSSGRDSPRDIFPSVIPAYSKALQTVTDHILSP